ncbi:MAG TPA: protocatechuate 3,4-dioxygenase subunit alpha [Terracidiphilus sp.]|nr:protocatechuate 3,4-dioxygenase subunit alpha [Terracidiphilus sp.]
MKLVPSGSQTVGPFFSIGLTHLCTAQPSRETPPVTVRGRVLDGNGDGVPDAVLEIWQADSCGLYSSGPADASGMPSGFARITSGEDGCFSFATCLPGRIAFDDKRSQAPHLVVLVFARGLLRQLITRMYFSGEALNDDPVLASIPEDRRRTLVARPGTDSTGHLEWNVVLQGEEETVFFMW